MFADANPDVDNMDRLNVMFKDFPAGNGYQNLIYYAQSIHTEGKLLRYDFGGVKNMDKYGTFYPPEVPLDQLSVPTGLFIGQYDLLATVKDNELLKQKLNEDMLVWDQVYPLGHLSFVLAKDMSFFTQDVVNLVSKYATNTYDDEALFLAIN